MSDINNIKTGNQAVITTPRNLKSKEGNESTQTPSVPEQAAASDKVSLTETATQLQSLRQVIADSPEVNADRVAAIKAAIADGSYSIDTEALAQNFMNFEKQI
jgi:negative regulator of flagellin synthesis FlgM